MGPLHLVLPPAPWHRSSYGPTLGGLEYRELPSGGVELHSATTGQSIIVLRTEWDAFVAGAKAGEFDC